MKEKAAPKSRFESEMTRLMSLAIDKIGNLETAVFSLDSKVSSLDSKVSGLVSKVSGLEQEVARNTQKLDVLIGQFSDVTSMVIKDNKRITKLEGEVADLQGNIH